MAKYIEFFKNLESPTSKRDKLITPNELEKHIIPGIDCYTSLFYYDEEAVDYVKRTGGISGFNGQVGSGSIAWDFDSIEDIEFAKKDTIKLITRLKEEYSVDLDSIRICFSGRKGFSVEVQTTGLREFDGILHNNIPEKVSSFAHHLAKDLPTFDKTLYQSRRLFRIPGTLHNKPFIKDNKEVSKLYKTHISWVELEKSIEEIIELCTKRRPPKTFKQLSQEPIDKLNNIPVNIKVSSETTHIEYDDIEDNLYVDMNKCPKGERPCVWKLCQGVETDSRNHALLRIACDRRDKGYRKESIIGLIQGVYDIMKKNNPVKHDADPMSFKDFKRIMGQAFQMDPNNSNRYHYNYGCNDGLLSNHCGKYCRMLNSSRINLKKLYNTADMEHSFHDFVKNIETNTIKTGMDVIDKHMKFFRGTLSLLIAAAGTGKTSMVLNLLRGANDKEIPCIFFSLDMTRDLTYAKIGSFVSGYSTLEVLSLWKKAIIKGDKKSKTITDKIKQKIKDTFPTTLFNFDTGLSVGEMKDYIRLIEEQKNLRVGFVIVDYASKMSHEKSDEYASETQNANHICDMAKDTNTCVIVLNQVSRANSGSNGDKPLSKRAAAGSGHWENNATNILTLWRPFKEIKENNPEDTYICLNLAKNRMGEEKVIVMNWEGKSGRISKLTQQQRSEYEALLEKKEQEEDF